MPVTPVLWIYAGSNILSIILSTFITSGDSDVSATKIDSWVIGLHSIILIYALAAR